MTANNCPMNLESLPATTLTHIFEIFASGGDGRTLGKVSCVSRTWKRTARDEVWKIACDFAQPRWQRGGRVVMANSLFTTDRFAIHNNPVTYTKVDRPRRSTLLNREAFFSVDGTVCSDGPDHTILRFVSAIASGEVDQVVLTPEAYFEDAINTSLSSTQEAKHRALKKVMDWALQIEWNHQELPHVHASLKWPVEGLAALPRGFKAFYSALRSVTPIIVEVLKGDDISFTQPLALDLVEALGSVSPHCGGHLLADFLINQSEIIPVLCTCFANSIGTQQAENVLSTIICVCCGNKNKFLWYRGEKTVTLAGIQAVWSCGIQGIVQRALEQGDAVAQEGSKLISWIHSSLPNATRERIQYPLECLNLIVSTINSEDPTALQTPAASDDPTLVAARRRFKTRVDSFVESLGALERQKSVEPCEAIKLLVAFPALAKLEKCLGSSLAKAISSLVQLVGFEGSKDKLEAYSTNFLMVVVSEMASAIYFTHAMSNDSDSEEEMKETERAQNAMLQALCDWLERRLNPGCACKMKLSVMQTRNMYGRGCRSMVDGGDTMSVDEALGSFLNPQDSSQTGTVEHAAATASRLLEMYCGAHFPGAMGLIDYEVDLFSARLVEHSRELRVALVKARAVPILLKLATQHRFHLAFAEVVKSLVSQMTEQVRESGFDALYAVPTALLVETIVHCSGRLDTNINNRGAMDIDAMYLNVLSAAAECLVLQKTSPSPISAHHVQTLHLKLSQIDVALQLGHAFLVQPGGQYPERWTALSTQILPGTVQAVLPLTLACMHRDQLLGLWNRSRLMQRAISPRMLFQAMQRHPESADAQTGGCEMVRILLDENERLENGFDFYQVAAEMLTEGAAEAIVAALREHKDNAAVVIAACRASNWLLDLDDQQSDEAKRPLAAAGAVAALLECQRTLRAQGPVVRKTLQVLESLVSCTAGMEALLEGDGVREMLLGMKAHPDNEDVQQHGCGALFYAELQHTILNINRFRATHGAGFGELFTLVGEEATQEVIKREGGVELGIAAMRAWRDNTELQHRACGMLRVCRYESMEEVPAVPGPGGASSCVSASGVQAGARTLFEVNGGPEVLEAMRRGRENHDVQMQAMLFLKCFFNDGQDSGSLVTKGVMSEALEVVRRYRSDSHTNSVAFSLLSELLQCGSAEDRESSALSFVELGGVEEAVESMQCHMDIAELPALLCYVLERVPDGVVRMLAKSGLEVVREAIPIHVGSEEVVQTLRALEGRLTGTHEPGPSCPSSLLLCTAQLRTVALSQLFSPLLPSHSPETDRAPG